MNTVEFFDAIREGNLNRVGHLLGLDPKLISTTDERGSTPLILAAYYNHETIVKSLLEAGAAIDEKDASGNTALMGVCFKGYTEIAKQLIEAGADVNAHNAMGSSCLIFATIFNRPEIAKLLLENGADVSAKDAKGNTAADHAKMQGLTHFETLLNKS